MNRKGFTLIELLATMAILAIISLIAVPNVLKIMSNNKKENVINHSMTMISLAKSKLASDYDLREQLDANGYRYTLSVLDIYSDITTDPDGIEYNRTNSYVKVYKDNNLIVYCAYLESDNWVLKDGSSCVLEDKLLEDNAKDYVKEN